MHKDLAKAMYINQGIFIVSRHDDGGIETEQTITHVMAIMENLCSGSAGNLTSPIGLLA